MKVSERKSEEVREACNSLLNEKVEQNFALFLFCYGTVVYTSLRVC